MVKRESGLMKEMNVERTPTTSRPAIDVERISVLERRSYLINVYEDYLINDKFGNKGRGVFDRVRAVLYSLILQIEGMLIRAFTKDKVLEWKVLIIKGDDQNKIEELITELNVYLDSINLTRLDMKKQRDRTNAIENYKNLGDDDY